MIEYPSYKVVAYVGSGKDDPTPLWSGLEGYQTFSDIFSQRPDWSRFVILQNVNKKYLCVDLFDTQYNLTAYELIMPPPLLFDDLDAAIMAAQLKL